MSQTVLDQAFLVEEADGIQRFRAVVTGSESSTCKLPVNPYNVHPIRVTTHAQTINGKPVGVRRFGVIKCEASSAIAAGDDVVIANTSGQIRKAPAAALVIGDTPSTNQVFITACQSGSIGNAVTLTLVLGSSGDPLEAQIVGNDITILLTTDDDSTSSTTAQQLVDFINSTDGPSYLVSASNGSMSDGSGIIAPVSKTSLSGGERGDFSFAVAQESATSAGDLIDILIK